MIAERAYWLAWQQLEGIGPVFLQRIRQRFGDLIQAWEADVIALQTVEGIGLGRAQRIVAGRRELDPDRILEQYQQYNPDFLTPSDPDYPALLREIPDAPTLLHYRGNLDLLRELDRYPGIALVGTRKPGSYGTQWTERYSQFLTQQGFTILSGLAEGIDAIAHQACLESQGRTIAVLGNGVDQIYPLSNRKLYDRIAESGLLLSEYPAGTRPDRLHFPARNRIVAGLSRAVLVMEAGVASGSLITAGQANEYGREVYALAGNLDSPQMEGCIQLILQGASILPKPETFLNLINALPQTSPKEVSSDRMTEFLQKVQSNLEPILVKILESIIALNNNAPIDLIIEQTAMTTPEVSSGLLQLELLGFITQAPGMRYAIVID